MDVELRVGVLVLLICVFSVSIYHRHRAEREGGALDRSQGGRTLVVLRLFALVGLAPLVVWLMQPAWVTWASFAPPTWLRWAAIAAGLALVPAFVWLFRTIGTNISPRETTREGHALITGGPYRYVRHPLYTFGLLFYVLLAIATGLWWLLVAAGIAFVALAWRTRREEANLVVRFGDDYRRYMRQTGRYLPQLRRTALEQPD